MWLASATSGRCSTARVSVSGTALVFPVHDPDRKALDVVSDGTELIPVLVQSDILQVGGETGKFDQVVVHVVGDLVDLLLSFGHEMILSPRIAG